MPSTFKTSVRRGRMKASLPLAAAAALAACALQDRRVTGPNPPNDAVVQVVTTPDTAILDPYQTRAFVAYGRTQAGDSLAVTVTWSASGGAITSGGLYTADRVAGVFQVPATMTGASLSASSRVRNRGPLAQVIVTPPSATLAAGGSLPFATYGRRRNGDSVAVSVAWSATGGTISSAGLYTGGSTAGAYRVIATQSGGTLADTAPLPITTGPVAAGAGSPATADVAAGEKGQTTADPPGRGREPP